MPNSRSTVACLAKFSDVEKQLAQHGVKVDPAWSDGECLKQLAKVIMLKTHGVHDNTVEQAQAMSGDQRSMPQRAAALASDRACLPQQAIAAVVVA